MNDEQRWRGYPEPTDEERERVKDIARLAGLHLIDPGDDDDLDDEDRAAQSYCVQTYETLAREVALTREWLAFFQGSLGRSVLNSRSTTYHDAMQKLRDALETVAVYLPYAYTDGADQAEMAEVQNVARMRADKLTEKLNAWPVDQGGRRSALRRYACTFAELFDSLADYVAEVLVRQGRADDLGDDDREDLRIRFVRDLVELADGTKRKPKDIRRLLGTSLDRAQSQGAEPSP